MSSSTVYGLWPGVERRVELVSYRNSHGMAPVVWNVLAQRYLHTKPHEWLFRAEELWPLADQSHVALSDKAVLKMTFDHCYILQADVPQAINDIAIFLYAHKDLIDPAAVNHWPAYANTLVTQWRVQPPAFGVHHTSVSENPWEGPYDEKLDARLPFDWSLASSVYEDLK